MKNEKILQENKKPLIEWPLFWVVWSVFFLVVYWLCVYLIRKQSWTNIGVFDFCLVSGVTSIVFLLFFTFIALISRNILVSKREKDYLEDLKYNWLWIIKKLGISKIEETYRIDSDGDPDFDWYVIEIKDWDKIYKTEKFGDDWIEYIGCSRQTYKLLDYVGVEFNPCDIKWIKEILKKKKFELESQIWLNSKFYRKFWKKTELRKVNELLDTFDEWAKVPVLKINWNKLTIWDEMTVIIDPENSKKYVVDTDFLLSQEEREDKQIRRLERSDNKHKNRWFLVDFLEVLWWMFLIIIFIVWIFLLMTYCWRIIILIIILAIICGNLNKNS